MVERVRCARGATDARAVHTPVRTSDMERPTGLEPLNE